MSRRENSEPNRLGAAWARLDARERRLVAIAATVVGLALLWWVGLAPALRTLPSTTYCTPNARATSRTFTAFVL